MSSKTELMKSFRFFSFFLIIASAYSQTVSVGAGSYATQLPPGKAGPPGTIYKTANVQGAVPTNDWWSSVAWIQYSEAMFPLPLSIKATSEGLIVGYPNVVGTQNTVFGSFATDLTISSTSGAPFGDTRLDGYGDWTVSFLWQNGGSSIRTTAGHGSPFVFATYEGGNAKIDFPTAPTVWSEEGNILGITINGHNYGIFGLPGSTWSGSGSTSLTNNGGDFISVAVISDNSPSTLDAYAIYAFNLITDTRVDWTFDETTSKLQTTFTATTQAQGGTTGSGTIFGLLPHQWKNFGGALLSYTYNTLRGQVKTTSGSSFQTELTYFGALPSLPDFGGYDASTLSGYVQEIRDEPNHYVTNARDTYWAGKFFQRITLLVAIARQAGNLEAANHFLEWLKTELAGYFVATDGGGGVKSDYLYYYDSNWGTLIGYPASYGSDTSLNDHHFHYGYWVRAAAEVAFNDDNWVSQWGPFVELIIQEIANTDRSDTRFPLLRNFDPYEGHSWASGDSNFADGNNQESSSEAANAWSAIILWGAATNNKAIRDLGIYLYTTETTSINQYWFNVDGDNFASGFGHNYAALIWGGKQDFATWFSPDPQQVRGINMLPISPTSLYLGSYPQYVDQHLNQLRTEHGSDQYTVWQDIIWEYQSFTDAAGALSLYNQQPGYRSEEGETRAHTYSMLYSMIALGVLNTQITADTALYAVFSGSAGTTYVAYNPTDSPVTVTFSDQNTLDVGPNELATNRGGGITIPTGTFPPATTHTGGTTSPITGGGSTFYLISGGTLSNGGGSGATDDTIAGADGGAHVGTPYLELVYEATGITGAYSAQQTTFKLAIDSETGIGNGIQAQVLYDNEGDGIADRTETYGYFPTNDVVGYEMYTDASGTPISVGTFSDLNGGSITIKIWSAIGTTDSKLHVNTKQGDQYISSLTIPFNINYE